MKSFYYLSENYLFLKTYVTSEGAVSRNVYTINIARYQVSRYANTYFGYKPIVSSAFNHKLFQVWLKEIHLYDA